MTNETVVLLTAASLLVGAHSEDKCAKLVVRLLESYGLSRFSELVGRSDQLKSLVEEAKCQVLARQILAGDICPGWEVTGNLLIMVANELSFLITCTGCFAVL